MESDVTDNNSRMAEGLRNTFYINPHAGNPSESFPDDPSLVNELDAKITTINEYIQHYSSQDEKYKDEKYKQNLHDFCYDLLTHCLNNLDELYELKKDKDGKEKDKDGKEKLEEIAGILKNNINDKYKEVSEVFDVNEKGYDKSELEKKIASLYIEDIKQYSECNIKRENYPILHTIDFLLNAKGIGIEEIKKEINLEKVIRKSISDDVPIIDYYFSKKELLQVIANSENRKFMDYIFARVGLATKGQIIQNPIEQIWINKKDKSHSHFNNYIIQIHLDILFMRRKQISDIMLNELESYLNSMPVCPERSEIIKSIVILDTSLDFKQSLVTENLNRLEQTEDKNKFIMSIVENVHIKDDFKQSLVTQNLNKLEQTEDKNKFIIEVANSNIQDSFKESLITQNLNKLEQTEDKNKFIIDVANSNIKDSFKKSLITENLNRLEQTEDKNKFIINLLGRDTKFNKSIIENHILNETDANINNDDIINAIKTALIGKKNKDEVILILESLKQIEDMDKEKFEKMLVEVMQGSFNTSVCTVIFKYFIRSYCVNEEKTKNTEKVIELIEKIESAFIYKIGFWDIILDYRYRNSLNINFRAIIEKFNLQHILTMNVKDKIVQNVSVQGLDANKVVSIISSFTKSLTHEELEKISPRVIQKTFNITACKAIFQYFVKFYGSNKNTKTENTKNIIEFMEKIGPENFNKIGIYDIIADYKKRELFNYDFHKIIEKFHLKPTIIPTSSHNYKEEVASLLSNEELKSEYTLLSELLRNIKIPEKLIRSENVNKQVETKVETLRADLPTLISVLEARDLAWHEKLARINAYSERRKKLTLKPFVKYIINSLKGKTDIDSELESLEGLLKSVLRNPEHGEAAVCYANSATSIMEEVYKAYYKQQVKAGDKKAHLKDHLSNTFVANLIPMATNAIYEYIMLTTNPLKNKNNKRLLVKTSIVMNYLNNNIIDRYQKDPDFYANLAEHLKIEEASGDEFNNINPDNGFLTLELEEYYKTLSEVTAEFAKFKAFEVMYRLMDDKNKVFETFTKDLQREIDTSKNKNEEIEIHTNKNNSEKDARHQECLKNLTNFKKLKDLIDKELEEEKKLKKQKKSIIQKCLPFLYSKNKKSDINNAKNKKTYPNSLGKIDTVQENISTDDLIFSMLPSAEEIRKKYIPSLRYMDIPLNQGTIRNIIPENPIPEIPIVENDLNFMKYEKGRYV